MLFVRFDSGGGGGGEKEGFVEKEGKVGEVGDEFEEGGSGGKEGEVGEEEDGKEKFVWGVMVDDEVEVGGC